MSRAKFKLQDHPSIRGGVWVVLLFFIIASVQRTYFPQTTYIPYAGLMAIAIIAVLGAGRSYTLIEMLYGIRNLGAGLAAFLFLNSWTGTASMMSVYLVGGAALLAGIRIAQLQYFGTLENESAGW